MHAIKLKLINEVKNSRNKLLTNCGDKHDNKASKHGDVISDPKRELKKKRYKSNSHPYICTILFHVIGNRNVVI